VAGSAPPLLIFLFLATTCDSRAVAADGPNACGSPVAHVVSIQGSIELRRAGQNNWAKVSRLDTPVCEGDRLRTGALSRTALFIQPETLVRVDQNTSIAVSQTKEETLVEFTQEEVVTVSTTPHTCGAGYFITRFPRKFKVNTPHLNAAVEGTEFLVAMRCESTELSVFEGKVLAEGVGPYAFDAQSISSGQTLSIGGAEPPAIKLLVKPADAVQWTLYYPPISPAGAVPEEDCRLVLPDMRLPCLIARAEHLLRSGRVEEAQAHISDALAASPLSSDAIALSSIISLVRNDKAEALRLAKEAITANSLSAPAWLAQSYAQQANFKLDAALVSARHASELTPTSALAYARVAELQLSLGGTREAEKTARQAVEANPSESRAHMILGFVHLAQTNVKAAREDFGSAIENDSTDPLSRLGLGLAIIREGKLREGREQIEVAVALDPTNSLLRSYVGKAYYEENSKERNKLAESQFGLAKELDPKDPTPWFYDAILRQTQNRPVEALDDLHKSIELNGNRAVYRSRLELDRDQGSRSARLAQIYEELGFQQLSVFEAYRSLETDPGNAAAHRFLSEAFAAMPRHELAQKSEMLQTQLRQPLTLDPIPPQRAFAGLSIPRSSGSMTASMHELNPLFVSQGLAGSLEGSAGELDTAGGQATVAVLGDKASARAGVFNYTTNGFRENNDLDWSIANAFFQFTPTSTFSAQAEFRISEVRYGDLPLRFDPTFLLPTRHSEEQDAVRVGAKYEFSPDVDFVFSGIYQDGVNTASIGPLGVTDKFNSLLLEAQSLVHVGRLDLIVGAGRLDGTLTETFVFFTNPEEKREQENAYLYASIKPGSFVQTIQLGLSMDRFDEAAIDRSEVNPKLGFVLAPASGTSIRAAYTRSLRRILPTGETIEPTQVAGFNQLFNDPEGTIASRWGIGLDQKLGTRAFAGVEVSKRDLTVPFIDFFLGTSRDVTWKESIGRAYLYWAPHQRVALTAEAFYERYERPATDSGEEQIVDLKSWRVPLGATVFFTSNWSARAAWTYWHQQGTFIALAGDTFPGEEDFSVVDFQLAYRFPARKGVFTIGANNLFDAKHNYQESDLSTPRYIPDRFAYVRFSLAF
jgi:tetratricopeptide (TPR) repeat protein